jgi:hypothetical protein
MIHRKDYNLLLPVKVYALKAIFIQETSQGLDELCDLRAALADRSLKVVLVGLGSLKVQPPMAIQVSSPFFFRPVNSL